MINWRVRIKQKWFWLAIIPAGLVLIRTVAAVAGFELDLTDLGTKLTNVIEAAFAVLAILGIVKMALKSLLNSSFSRGLFPKSIISVNCSKLYPLRK